MTDGKPKDVNEYIKWLKDKHNIEINNQLQQYYDSVTNKIERDLKRSENWVNLLSEFPDYNDEYLIQSHGYDLFMVRDDRPVILIKPFNSLIEKTFRKNILLNKNWPNGPEGGWIVPSNWFSRINDIVRTLIQVKYLDGVEFLINKINSHCEKQKVSCTSFLEARDVGYYAAHLYIRNLFEIPKINWDTDKVDVSFEIQITTQLQDVIRKLLHTYYEEKRVNSKDKKWQWDYKSDEFSANYLGHILHYLEGMIMEIRDKEIQKQRLK
jgi:hypothetical protein